MSLLKSHTLHNALDQLDVIKCVETSDHRRYFNEILTKQKDLYMALVVTPPSL